MNIFNKDEFLKNIADNEERLVYARSLDKAMLAAKKHIPAFSAFLDPFKLSRFYKMIATGGGLNDLQVIAYGGFEESERKMLGFFPDFYIWQAADFPITAVEISFNKFSTGLTHRDFLGSVLGLGITRDKVGDIIVESDSERAIVFADESIADYISANLERVGHTKVKVKILEEYIPKATTHEEKKLTVASMRLDAVLGACFNMSRTRVAELIKGEKAYVNWLGESSTAKQLKEGDIVTLRGSGRIRIMEINGKTKKDRFLITVEKF